MTVVDETIQLFVGDRGWFFTQKCVTPDAWHFIAATCQAGGSGTDATIILWLDGMRLAQGSITLGSGFTIDTWQLGKSAGLTLCATAAVWTKCLQPLQTGAGGEVAPVWQVFQPADDLLWSVDLTGTTPVVLGSGMQFQASSDYAPFAVVSGATLDGAGCVLPGVDDPVCIGTDAAFTVSAWVQPTAVPALLVDGNTQCIVSCGSDGADGGVSVSLWWSAAGGTWRPVVGIGDLEDAFASADDVPSLQPGAWVWIALTYDESTLTLYVNGVPSATAQVAATSTAAPGFVIGAVSRGTEPFSFDQGFTGRLQSVASWSRCLSPEEVTTVLTDGPLQTDGLTGFYRLAAPLEMNVVTNDVITAVGDVQFADETARLLATVETDLRRLSDDPPPAEVPGARLAAMLDRLDTTDSTEPLPLDQAEIDRIIEHFEVVLAQVESEPLRGQYRDQFRNNLLLGLRLQKSLPAQLPGSVVSRRENGQVIFSVATETGVEDIHSVDALTMSPCTEFWIKIIADGVNVVLSLVGVVAAAAPIVKSLVRFAQLRRAGYEMLDTSVRTIFAAPVTGSTFIYIMRALAGAHTLVPVLISAITGSWWRVATVLASVLGQILAAIGSGGALLAAWLVNLATSIGTLVYDLTHGRPSGCNAIPVLHGLSPNSVTAGSPQFTLTVSGTGIMQQATLSWDAVSLDHVVVSDSDEIAAPVPASNVTSMGTHQITVTNPDSPSASKPLTFTVAEGS